jgi:hypothetical protein
MSQITDNFRSTIGTLNQRHCHKSLNNFKIQVIGVARHFIQMILISSDATNVGKYFAKFSLFMQLKKETKCK